MNPNAAPTLPAGNTAYTPRASVRVRASNVNHHLWNNNGTWYLHYTVHPTPFTKSRVRVSLGTKSVDVARQRRDEVLAREVASSGVPG